MGDIDYSRLAQHSAPSSLTDAAARWRLARLRAFQLVKPQLAIHVNENAALLAAGSWTPDEQQHLLRSVFDTSRAFGKSLAGFSGGPWPLHEIRHFVAETGIVCFAGQWGSVENSAQFARTGCSTNPGTLTCDYWREALDGLTMGLGDTTRYARHRSLGHGDSECVDILYDERDAGHQHGPLPGEMRSILDPVIERMAQNGVKLNLQGYSEGTLYYTMTTSSGPACGAGKDILLTSFRKTATQSFPALTLVDSSPRAVYGEP